MAIFLTCLSLSGAMAGVYAAAWRRRRRATLESMRMWEVRMLGDRPAMATVAVRKLDVAKKFYEGKLGLELTRNKNPGPLVQNRERRDAGL